jgi:hypothetical protein
MVTIINETRINFFKTIKRNATIYLNLIRKFNVLYLKKMLSNYLSFTQTFIVNYLVKSTSSLN